MIFMLFIDMLFIEKTRAPHVFLIYQNGLFMDYSTDTKISPVKNFSFNLQESVTSQSSGSHYYGPDEQSVHMGFANNENIYIFYGDGQKSVTYIDTKTQKVRAMPKTKLEKPCHGGSGIKVGDTFLMACDRKTHMYDVHQLKVKALLWSDKRQRFVNYTYLTATNYNENCLTPLNRCVVLSTFIVKIILKTIFQISLHHGWKH